MEISKKILVGMLSNLGNMKMYRQAEPCFDTTGCKTNATNDGLELGSFIVVTYKEWVENSSGKEIANYTFTRRYVLKDDEVFKPVITFLNNMWRVVLASERGLGVQIENVIERIPYNAEDGYVVTLNDLTKELPPVETRIIDL
jgi:hypothetical protein